MKIITKKQKDWLIENKHIPLRGGKYLDLLITSKRKKGGGKTYYTLDRLADLASKHI